jgi:hypothetical protein
MAASFVTTSGYVFGNTPFVGTSSDEQYPVYNSNSTRKGEAGR